MAMTHAQEVGPAEAPQLYALVKRLTERDGLPMPRLYIVPDPTPNAFATGRDPQHAAVAVNEGLLEILNEDEVEGVIAHELSHVKHRDILISTIAATMAGALVMLSRMAWWGMMLGGYGGEWTHSQAPPFWLGLAGLLLAPSRGVLIYSPAPYVTPSSASGMNCARRKKRKPCWRADGPRKRLGELQRSWSAGSSSAPPSSKPRTANYWPRSPSASGLRRRYAARPRRCWLSTSGWLHW